MDAVRVTDEFVGLVTSTRSRPLSPGGPAGPAGPAGPVGPAGSCPGAKSARSNERFATFADVTAAFLIFGFVTAPVFSCAVPTVFLPSWLTAATLVPPNAIPRARHAMTSAGEGRRSESIRIL
jgi:hypothetical protein